MDPRTVFFTGVFLMLLVAVTEISTDNAVLCHVPYHFFKTPKNWSEAQNFCRVQYTDLATVDNIKEHSELMKGMVSAGATFLWIGLEKSATYRWVWSDGIGDVVVYPWDKGLDYDDCVIMHSNGFWYTRNCSLLIASLCFTYDSKGKLIYVLNTTLLSWRDAQAFCRRHHTDLVSVKTGEQNTEIRTQGQGNNIWIGAFRDYWMWSDRSTSSFRYWAKSRPDNHGGAESCGLVRENLQYLWEDSSCHFRYAFACYGEHKLKRTVVKVRISSEVNLNLPAESDSLLKQLQAWLEEQGVTEVKVRWLADKNKPIFHREKEKTKETGC